MFNERTSLSKEIAEKAGKAILEIQNGDMQTHEKGCNDVLTIADTTSEKMIVNAISEMFPDDGFVAEEGSSKESKSGYTWVIDPLDGTMNFSRSMSYYAVSIGYLKDGKPYGGAVYIPKLKELFVCEKGKGAYLNGEQIHVSTNNLNKSLAVIGFNNRQKDFRKLHCNIHKNLLDNIMNVEKIFSTVIGICYVACGRIEIHCELNCFLWDVMPSCLMIEEAGGKITQINGENIDFTQVEKQCVVGTNGLIHSEILKLLN